MSKSLNGSSTASSKSQVSLDQATPELLHQMLKEQNERQTTWNLAICCIVLFCAEASRGLFIPSLWSCVQHIGLDKSFLSWCIPLFSVGRMFGSYLAGSMSDRWNDDGYPTVACLMASIGGGLIYVMADMNQSWILLLLAEFGMGLGGGTLAVLRAHVSKITTDKLRMSHTTYISTAQFVGLGLMPLAALGINYYFIGPHHHEELAAVRASSAEMMAIAGTSLIADHLGRKVAFGTGPSTTSRSIADAMTSEQHDFTEQQHQRIRSHGASSGSSGLRHPLRASGRAHYHAGLENSDHSYQVSNVHAAKSPSQLSHRPLSGGGGRHLLSATSTLASVASLTVGPDGLVHPYTGEPATFMQRFLNHRTAPAHLLVLLNLGCLVLYFLYFDSQHESFEYKEKKKSEAAKKKLASQVAHANANGEFDVDNEADGPSGAFHQDRSGEEITPAAAIDAVTIGRTKKGEVKEIVFDVSKLSSLSSIPVSPPTDGGDGAAVSPSSAADVSVVQVRDTTVITLAPFKGGESNFSGNETKKKKSKSKSNSSSISSSADSGVELDARVPSSSFSPSKSKGEFSFRKLTHGIVSLFSGGDNKSTSDGINSSSSAGGGVGGSVTSSADSQRQRISKYESGSARVDIDDEGVYFAGLHLTPDRMVLWGSCLFVYLNYTIRGVLATVETVGTPTLAKFHGIPPGPLEVEVSAKFFGILGLLGCVVFFLQWYFQDYIDEPTSLIAGFVVTVIGSSSIMAMQDSEAGFIFGCVCIWSFGLPAVQNSVLAALSRILGTRPQGTWMGWIQTFGSLGRVTFPLITKIFSVEFAFAVSSFGCGIAIIALFVYMKLVKMTM